jgi:ribonuclease Z
MHLLGRTNELNIYAPKDLNDIINLQLQAGKSFLNYPVIFNETLTDKSRIIFENEKVTISTIILKHKIPCTGFLFTEKPKPRKINPDALKEYNIPKYEINNLKKGSDFINKEGETIKNNRLTHNPSPSFSYAFCSDTSYSEEIIDTIEGVDLLYHEATFTEEHNKRAKATQHSTAKQAATIALKANAKQLIIGHFSNRYQNLTELLNEGKSIFENTELAEDDQIFNVSKSQQTQC